MGFPQYYEGAAKNFWTGRRTLADTNPIALTSAHLCRRILLVADNGDVAYIVPNGQPAAVGFPIPTVGSDGNFTPLELWLNDLQTVWVVGAAGGEVINYYCEEI